MKTAWEVEYCGSTKPEQFQKLDPDGNSYMQRKNIEEVTETDGEGNTYTSYKCMSRFISKDVYEEFMDALDTPTQIALMEQFKVSDENTLAIMSAIAEIYEMNL